MPNGAQNLPLFLLSVYLTPGGVVKALYFMGNQMLGNINRL
ncbi:MAG: hypothetical protein AAFU56_05770 [Pseudomonadota bacterium]